jgi:hypothetical protein
MPGCRPLLLLLGLAPAALAAAEPVRSIHDPTGYPLVWNQPGAERVEARTGLVFARPLDRDLALDLYPPAGAAPGARRPAVVFLAGFGDDPAAPLRSWEIYRSWLRTVAARGYVGVMGESDPRDVPGSLAALFRYLDERGGELGIDSGRLLVWACSANVRGALPFLMAEGAPRGVVAAALLYGAGEAERVRVDLPVLLVVAGRDGPELLEQERALAGRARAAQAPWTVIEAPGLPHAFDAFDRSPESLATIAQVLGFIDARLGAPPPPVPESAERRAARTALGQLFGHDFEAAQDYYNELVDGAGRGDRQVWENLAWARRGMGSQIGEMVALEQAVRLAPGDWALRQRYTRLAARLGGWREVEEALAPFAEDPRADAVDLGLLGLARLQLDQPAGAVAPLERAVALGGEPGTRYNLACARARSGEIDAALAALAGAIDAGFADTRLLAEDADLAPLRADPRFAELVRRAAARTAPAEGEPHG